MPTTHTVIDIATLRTAAHQLTTLLPRLQALIPDQPTTLESQHGAHRKHVAAPIPWNTPAAMLALDIHAAARRLESALTIRLFRKATYRGGDDATTLDIIKRLPDLIAHAHQHLTDPGDIDGVTDIAYEILSWPRQVRALLDEPLPGEQRWTRAPGDLRCPYCDKNLELEPGWIDHPEAADVICRRCEDAYGRMLRWEPTTWIAVLNQADAG